jgi:hypothetical protein
LLTSSEAKQELAALRQDEAALLNKHTLIMERAWRIGRNLAQLKAGVPHGLWETFLCANLPELGNSERARLDNARRCITLYRRNEKYENSRAFTNDSERKFMWNYIPAKEREALPGDQKEGRMPPHHLTFVNFFCKWDRQVQIGKLPLPPEDVLRFEPDQVLARLIALLGRDYVRNRFFRD